MRWQIGIFVAAVLVTAGCGAGGTSGGGGVQTPAPATATAADQTPAPVNMASTSLPAPAVPPLQSLTIASQLGLLPQPTPALPAADKGADIIAAVTASSSGEGQTPAPSAATASDITLAPVGTDLTNPPAPPLDDLTVTSQFGPPPEQSPGLPPGVPPGDTGAGTISGTITRLMDPPPVSGPAPEFAPPGPFLPQPQVVALLDLPTISNPEPVTLLSSLLALGGIAWTAQRRRRA